MLKKFFYAVVFSFLVVPSIFAAAKFPFPQDLAYPYGIKPAGADHNSVQAAYTVFMTNFYEESGTTARIKWDTPALTVSEGIGYGMLIMVYMDNTANNTQEKFDKLWQTYQNNYDGNGLMNWKINGYSGISGDGQNGATDGDIDVALALCLAYYQWSDNKYKTAATGLLGKIWQFEVNAGKGLKPGDMFDNPKNPSYLITAALSMFPKFDTQDWASVKTNSYSLLKSAQNATTGLVPDWCDDNGAANSRGPDYTFDAARTPWRMAMAYCWNGDADAKTVAGKMNSWIQSSTGGDPSLIKSGYRLAGASKGDYNLPTYIGPFACAAMVDNGSQTFLNAAYNRLCTFIDNDNYYNQCLKVLSLLLLTGNAPDFSTATPKTAFKVTSSVSPASAGSVTVTPNQATYTSGTSVTITAVPTGANKFVSWGGDLSGATASQTVTITHDMNVAAYFNAGAGDLIDDCEDGNNTTNLGGKWFTYNDSTDKGLSTVTPRTSDALLFAMTAGGANSSAKAAKISYTLNKGTNPYNPYAGFGFWLKKQSTTDTVLDISAATGLTFYFKGDTCDVRVETTNITDYGYYFKRIPKAADWTLISLKWTDMAQATWAKANTFDRTKATKVAWQTPNTGVTGNAGDIWVDDIHLPGFVVPATSVREVRSMPQQEKGFSVSSGNAKSMTLQYDLGVAGAVEVGLFDMQGKLVSRLYSGLRPSGRTMQTLCVPETGNLRGTYLVQVKSAAGVMSGKIVLVK